MNLKASTETPIFIVGVPRSGTTLLRLILTSHPDICIPPESTFFVDLEQKYSLPDNKQIQINEFIAELYDNKKFREWNINRFALQQRLENSNCLTYCDYVVLIYKFYLEQNKLSASIWGDKNPQYIYDTDLIFKYFPQARVIHIVRDVRAVYSSLNQIKINNLWKKHSSNFTINKVTSMWNKALDISDKYKNDSRFYLLKYEELVSEPQKQINYLCQWLNIKFDKQMLLFYQDNLEQKLVPQHRLGWHKNTLKPICIEQINSWQNKLNNTEIEVLEILNKNRLTQMDYELLKSFIRYRGWFKILWEDIFRKLTFFKNFNWKNKLQNLIPL